MRKQYQIENLDCAHCAMKMEEAARLVPGVLFVNVNFVSQRLTLEAEDRDFDAVFCKVEEACRKIEPDVCFRSVSHQMDRNQKRGLIRIIVSVALFVSAMVAEKCGLLEGHPLLPLLAFLPAYLFSGLGVVKKAVLGCFRGSFFDENFLMSLATFGAFAIGEAEEGVMVMVQYTIGEFFQELAVSRSRRSIAELMNIRPDSASLLQDGKVETVSPESVPVGSMILVKPGEKVPLDGTVLEGSGFLDTGALTGESVPREVSVGDTVKSGYINMNTPLVIRTDKVYAESTVARILSLIEDAGEGKSKAERFITRFARFYTPVVVILALCLALIPPLLGASLAVWMKKAVVCLVISCPCALVISVPLTFFGGIGCAGSHGILIKGADSLEKLAKIRSVAFDKTGTLTKGVFQVTAIHPEMMQDEALLELATTCEHYSNHPISHSLKAAFRGEIDPSRIGKIREHPGEGVEAEVDGILYYVGNEKLMQQAKIEVHPCARCHHVGTVVHVASRTEYLGHIVISDEIREDAKETVDALHTLGVDKIWLLSGDEEETASSVANALGIDHSRGKLLPEEKLATLDALSRETLKGQVAFVGDGINDTPTLARADLGIAMGGIGADAAVEAADIVLIDDRPSKLVTALLVAKKTLSIVWQNVILSVGIKLTVLIPNIFWGEESVPAFLAVFADVGICLIAVLNSTRALRLSEKRKK